MFSKIFTHHEGSYTQVLKYERLYGCFPLKHLKMDVLAVEYKYNYPQNENCVSDRSTKFTITLSNLYYAQYSLTFGKHL